MKRTQIYISEEQDRRLAAMATEREISKAELIRQLLDRALEPGHAEAVARHVIQETRGVCADYPDWPEWLRSVRGRSADERLRAAGL
ncbi:MAG: ribbon-helix-helix protein, CopG family [Thermoleophilia bacterium]|nr:ribbon-helix-helix protein, CopG family [Thermoleophilia bacterium]